MAAFDKLHQRMSLRLGPDVARLQILSVQIALACILVGVGAALAAAFFIPLQGELRALAAALAVILVMAAGFAVFARQIRVNIVNPASDREADLQQKLDSAPSQREIDNLSNVCERRTEQLDAALNDNSQLRGRLNEIQAGSRFSHNSLDAVIASSAELLLVVDVAEQVVACSPPMARLVGLRAKEVESMPLDDVLFVFDPTKDRPREYRMTTVVADALSRRSEMPRIQEALLIDKKNVEHSILLSSSTIADDRGEPIAALLRAEPYGDQSAKAISDSTKSMMKSSHGLSDMAGRDAFNRRFDELQLIAKNQQAEHGLLLISIDNLQQIYDDFGHDGGDEMVWQFGRIVEDEIGNRADCYAITPLHFAAFLAFSDMSKAATLAEHLRRRIDGHEFQWQDDVFSITVSIAVLTISAKSGARSDLLATGSSMLTAAKKAGGNSVSTASDEDDLDDFARQVDQKLMNWLGSDLQESHLHLMSREVLVTSSQEEGLPMIETHLKVELDDGFWIDPMPFLRSAQRRGMASRIDMWMIENVLEKLNTSPGLRDGFEFVLVPIANESVSDGEFMKKLASTAVDFGDVCGKVVLIVDEGFSRSRPAQISRFCAGLKDAGMRWGFGNCRQPSFNDQVSRLGPAVAILNEDLSSRLNGSVVAAARLNLLTRLAQHYGFRLVASNISERSMLEHLANSGVSYASEASFDGIGPLVV